MSSYILRIALSIIVSATGCGTAENLSGTGPQAKVDAHEVTIKTSAENEIELVKFAIRNSGSAPFEIKNVSASCGCSSTSVEPRKVLPGREAILTAKITPINVGSNQIVIEAFTDIPDQPILTMRVYLLGTGKVPYIANSSDVIAFGNLARYGDTVPFFFETRESIGSVPWLHTPFASIPGISIRGGLNKERSMDSRVVYRRYEFLATLDDIRSTGEFRGELRLPDNMHPKPFLHNIILIHGSLIPKYQISPGAVFGTFSKFEDIPAYTISFRKTDNPDRLRIDPSNVDAKRYFIERISEENGTASFRLRIAEPFGKALDDELVFRTGTDEMPEIRLPVRIRIRD
jgi:hypothetical protein